MSENSFKILLENFAIFDFSARDIRSLMNLVSVNTLKKKIYLVQNIQKKRLSQSFTSPITITLAKQFLPLKNTYLTKTDLKRSTT